MPEPRGSERARIAALLTGLPEGEGVVVGAGDDAAVLRPREGRDLVATTDTFVETRHFRRDLLMSAEVGVRLAAANLSDMAAMAAEPRWALISLVVPPSWSAADCQLLERSCARALFEEGVAVVGGNLASGEGSFAATVTLLGEVERGGAWTRAGARAGDVLAVTGVPGSAGVFLAAALSGGPPNREHVPGELSVRFVAPPCRVRFARALAGTGAVRAAIDISDGLAADLAHLCAASGVGARVVEALLPVDAPLAAAARALSAEGTLLTQLRLGPSDDYELVLAVDPERWDACARIAGKMGVPLTRIGAFTGGDALVLAASGGEERPLDTTGWDHFAADRG